MARRKRTKQRFPWLFTWVVILICSVITVGMLWGIPETGKRIDEQLYFPKDEEHPEDLMYQQYVDAAADEFEVDPAIIYAVIYCESNFDADAVSSAGALGLMQMMPATFEEMQFYLKETRSEEELFDPQINIRYGAYYLSRLYKRFENWETAFAAYNAGPTIVSKWLKDDEYSSDGKTLSHIPYSETSHYVKKVNGMVEKYNVYYQTEVQNDT